MTIRAVASALRGGRLDVRDLVEEALTVAADRDGQINAMVTATAELARRRAVALDEEAARGRWRSVLHGMPIVHKDNVATAGIPTTCGCVVFERAVPELDAAVVARLDALGAVTIGKSNMNELAAGLDGRNGRFGITRNPRCPSHSAGGSSCGSAAAVASGQCVGATGTDTGGSVRVPAAWCGVVGLRPTHGRVPLHGVFPRAPSLDVIGPITACVDDARVLWRAMAGRRTNPMRRADVGESAAVEGRGTRVGVEENWISGDLEPKVTEAIHESAARLSELGCEVVSVDLPLLRSLDMVTAFSHILLWEFREVIESRLAHGEELELGERVRGELDRARMVTADMYRAALRLREAAILEFEQGMRAVDVLMTPTTPTLAPPLSEVDSSSYAEARRFVSPVSLIGAPAISVSAGLAPGGLPIGVQYIAAPNQEELLFDVGEALERDKSGPSEVDHVLGEHGIVDVEAKAGREPEHA